MSDDVIEGTLVDDKLSTENVKLAPEGGKLAKIEGKLEKDIAISIELNAGAISFKGMGQVMEFAKLMSLSGAAVPAHLQGNPGACLAVTMQALEWGMNPYAVAQKSYIAKEGQPIAYEAQLWHAVAQKRAPIIGRFRYTFTGEGQTRRCTVSAQFRGDEHLTSLTSETLQKLMPASGDRGLKGSPLWQKKPDVQLMYNTLRDFIRVHCPEVMLGVYTPDELEDMSAGKARDVTPVQPFKDPQISADPSIALMSDGEFTEYVDKQLRGFRTADEIAGFKREVSMRLDVMDPDERGIVDNLIADAEQTFQ